MASAAGLTEVVLYDTLVNYLVSMARTVEGAMNRALDAIVSLESPRTAALPGEVFLLEPRINEMEIVIDEHAIRLLRRGSYSDDEMRLIVVYQLVAVQHLPEQPQLQRAVVADVELPRIAHRADHARVRRSRGLQPEFRREGVGHG